MDELIKVIDAVSEGIITYNLRVVKMTKKQFFDEIKEHKYVSDETGGIKYYSCQDAEEMKDNNGMAFIAAQINNEYALFLDYLWYEE